VRERRIRGAPPAEAQHGAERLFGMSDSTGLECSLGGYCGDVAFASGIGPLDDAHQILIGDLPAEMSVLTAWSKFCLEENGRPNRPRKSGSRRRMSRRDISPHTSPRKAESEHPVQSPKPV